jgi:hypothetical protein
MSTLVSVLRFASYGLLIMLMGCGPDPQSPLPKEVQAERDFFIAAARKYPGETSILHPIGGWGSAESEAMGIASSLNYCRSPPCYVGVTHPDGAFLVQVLTALCTQPLPFPKSRSNIGIYIDPAFVDSAKDAVADCGYLQSAPSFEGRDKVSIHAGYLKVRPPPPSIPIGPGEDPYEALDKAKREQ